MKIHQFALENALTKWSAKRFMEIYPLGQNLNFLYSFTEFPFKASKKWWKVNLVQSAFQFHSFLFKALSGTFQYPQLYQAVESLVDDV